MPDFGMKRKVASTPFVSSWKDAQEAQVWLQTIPSGYGATNTLVIEGSGPLCADCVEFSNKMETTLQALELYQSSGYSGGQNAKLIIRRKDEGVYVRAATECVCFYAFGKNLDDAITRAFSIVHTVQD